ncbi:hypothetical protein [Quadrisphaera sp. KR29]|uniref:hypothetical protein n=1 Tax=Quadrisphaera sp. KR29 TaxID=3461391 RepID=UPI004043F836
MPESRLSLLVALVVVVALAVLTAQCAVLLLQQQALPHAAWRVGLGALALTGVWWLLNGPLEGPTLVRVSWSHGLTAADVLGLPALVLGAAVLAQSVRA